MKKMFKRLFLSAVISFVSFTVFADQPVFPVAVGNAASACSNAVLHTAAKTDFCSAGGTGFPAIVTCNCLAKHEPAGICNNPKGIYSLMKVQYAAWGSAWLQHACAGHGTTIQECEDQWNCYMYGTHGTDATQKISNGACFGQTDATPC
ncbi:MAG: hypothetical protein Q8L78_03220 [Coxiellaceae bacterium]|nr:hypothetical protein [Coxiellaceae bacterium]